MIPQDQVASSPYIVVWTQHIDEVTHVEPEFDTIWDEELLVTSNRDVEDITYEYPVGRDMIIPCLMRLITKNGSTLFPP